MDKLITLFDKFKQVKYTDVTHSYSFKGKNLLSVTQFLGKLKPKFNADYWLTYKTCQTLGYKVKPYFTKLGISETSIFLDGDLFPIDAILTEEVVELKKKLQKEWNIKSDIGTTRGSFVHNYLENLERGIVDVPNIILPKNLTTLQAIDYVNSIDTCKQLCFDYLNNNDHLVPVAIEFKIADLDLGIAGTFDRLYWNKVDKEYQIHDFKTDKKIDTKGKYDKIKLFDIPFCELNKYSLQTSIYKYIIEKNTKLKLGKSKITHFNIVENQLDYYDCEDYTEQIKKLSNGNDWSTYLQP